jgi:hypothetical protein
MTRTELEILLKRYVAQAAEGDFIVVECGPAIVQAIVKDGAVTVEARGDDCPPELLRTVDEAFAAYRPEGQSTSETSSGCLTLMFGPGNARVAEAMGRALDVLAGAVRQPSTLTGGQGTFMPKRKGFLGLGGFGPIV